MEYCTQGIEKLEIFTITENHKCLAMAIVGDNEEEWLGMAFVAPEGKFVVRWRVVVDGEKRVKEMWPDSEDEAVKMFEELYTVLDESLLDGPRAFYRFKEDGQFESMYLDKMQSSN